MDLVDVNVLIYAHNRKAVNHEHYREWLERLVESDAAFGMSEFVLTSFSRIITNPKIMRTPMTIQGAFKAADELRDRPNCVMVSPGPRHWDLFRGLCISVGAKGNLVTDAYLAALAIESGSEWVTTDSDFAVFPGLRWRNPLTGG